MQAHDNACCRTQIRCSVFTVSTGRDISAGATFQRVIVVATIEHIVAGATGKVIAADQAIEVVLFALGVQDVFLNWLFASASEKVGAIKHVIICRTDVTLNVVNFVALCIAPPAGAVLQVDSDARRRSAIGYVVLILYLRSCSRSKRGGTPFEYISAFTADEQVPGITALQNVITAVAIQNTRITTAQNCLC